MAEDRQKVVELVAETCQAGARKAKACETLGVSVRTLQRWRREGLQDRRVGSRVKPANALSEAEREQLRELLVSPAYRDLSPKQIVPRLADEGIYVASESSLYRILRAERPASPAQSSREWAQTGQSPRRRAERSVELGYNLLANAGIGRVFVSVSHGGYLQS